MDFSCFSNQAPHLAAGDAPAVVELGLAPTLTQTQHVAVALIVVRSDAAAEEVDLDVTAELHGSKSSFRKHAETRLARTGVPFRCLPARISGEGDVVERAC